jgi:hypothetical protein
MLLLRAFSSRTTTELHEALGPRAEAVAPRLEALLKILFEHRATLDIQTRGEHPVRVTYERAAALYNALREPIDLPDESFVATARLVGAYFDTKDFKLRLDETWRGKRVIHGKYREGIAPEVEKFVNQKVLAEVSATEERRGAHGLTVNYTLTSVREPPHLPFE